jgi:hypothetical protein
VLAVEGAALLRHQAVQSIRGWGEESKDIGMGTVGDRQARSRLMIEKYLLHACKIGQAREDKQ